MSDVNPDFKTATATKSTWEGLCYRTTLHLPTAEWAQVLQTNRLV